MYLLIILLSLHIEIKKKRLYKQPVVCVNGKWDSWFDAFTNLFLSTSLHDILTHVRSDLSKLKWKKRTVKHSYFQLQQEVQCFSNFVCFFFCFVFLVDAICWIYRKNPKISPGAYIFQKTFLRGLFLEGAYIRRGLL